MEMELVLAFITKHMAFFSSIVGTVVGGVLTFLTTMVLEKKREKRSAQKEKLEKILIPYCTSIEQAEESIQKLNKKSVGDFQEFWDALRAPLEFQKAARRVYLKKSQRKQLKHYELVYDEFIKRWKENERDVVQKYTKYVAEQMKQFDCSSCITLHVNIKFAQGSFNSVYWDLICDGQRTETLLDKIIEVDFIHNEDDPMGVESTCIKITKATRETEKALCAEVRFPEDLSDEEILSVRLLEFINELDDRAVLRELIGEKKTSDQLHNLEKELQEMNQDLIHLIDRIAG